VPPWYAAGMNAGRDHRLGTLLLLAPLLGCAASVPPHLLLPDAAPVSLSELAARYPLPPHKPVRAERLGATAHVSYQLVQLQPGAGERPHLHAQHDLIALMLAGHGTQWVGERAYPMETGDSVVIASGTPHHFVNTGEEPAAALVIFSPPYDGGDQVFLDKP
jgi:quercetin dioxygenase-like cupin family protein